MRGKVGQKLNSVCLRKSEGQKACGFPWLVLTGLSSLSIVIINLISCTWFAGGRYIWYGGRCPAS